MKALQICWLVLKILILSAIIVAVAIFFFPALKRYRDKITVAIESIRATWRRDPADPKKPVVEKPISRKDAEDTAARIRREIEGRR